MINRKVFTIFVLAMFAVASPSTAAALVGGPTHQLAAIPPSLAPSTAAAAPKVNVAIQAGHWKSAELPEPLAQLRTSTGAYGGGRTESQVTLDIAQRVARILRGKGLAVEVLPATIPTGYKADLFISLHADGNNSAGPRGYKVSTRWRSEVAALDALLVQSIEEGYGAVTKMPQDGSITRAMRGYYAYSTYRGEEYRLGETTPAAILEMGFMSNPTDRAIMFDNPDLVARGVVAGVENYYAQRAAGLKLQAAAERQAEISPYGRSAVALSDSVNVRAGASATTPKLDSADLGESFPLQEAGRGRSSSGGAHSGGGTQLVAGWYKISLPGGSTSIAYISRDYVVVQQ